MANHAVLRSIPVTAFVVLMAAHASAQERYVNASVAAGGALQIVTAAGQVIVPAPEPERGTVYLFGNGVSWRLEVRSPFGRRPCTVAWA